MIVNFGFTNFGPIKEEQVLSFEADKSDHLEDYYVIKAGSFRLLKFALIYGANASGKTTILKGLDFLRQLVLEPVEKKTDPLDFQPFLFDPDSPQQSSQLSIDLIQNGIRYDYTVEFTKEAIISEQLDYYHPKKANVFKRTTNVEQQLTEIIFGSKIKKDKFATKTLKSNTLWNNTVLGGFLKTNVDIFEMKEVTDWFHTYLRSLIYSNSQLETGISKMIEKNHAIKKGVISILQKADLHISDIIVETSNYGDFFDYIQNSFSVDKRALQDFVQNSDKYSPTKVKLAHTVAGQSYHLPIEEESLGTQRYYVLAGLLAQLISQSQVLPIDELEASLHPDLFTQFILTYLVNSKNSQLLATTHNREILNDKDIFRNDAIWFTDKSADAATELYSLADFDSATVRDTTNVLNAYKSGKLRGIPNLGDYYLELD